MATWMVAAEGGECSLCEMQQLDVDVSSSILRMPYTFDISGGIALLKMYDLLGQSHEVSRRAKNDFFSVNMSNRK
jgi:hypothetical protein